MEVKTWNDLREVTEDIYTTLCEACRQLARFVEREDPPCSSDPEVQGLLGHIRDLRWRIPHICVGCEDAPLQDLAEEMVDIAFGAYHVLHGIPTGHIWWYSDLEKALADVDRLLARTMDVRDEISRHLRATQAQSCAG
jgi:hypothetical protein